MVRQMRQAAVTNKCRTFPRACAVNRREPDVRCAPNSGGEADIA
jgi:hypothetical protein